MNLISSTQNKRIRYVKSLQNKARLRRSERRLILEGDRLITDALQRGGIADLVLYSPKNADYQLIARLQDSKCTLLPVSQDVLGYVSDTQQPPGMLGVFHIPRPPIPQSAERVLILDSLREPGNVGTVLRTAAAAGAGPPMLSTLYNNHKRIVQSPDHIMILTEMVHDARIVRMNAEHAPADVRRWVGDSIGWWDGDTLVVDTINFNDTPSLGAATRDLHVVERFSRIDEDTLLYNFTVEDPNTWEGPWTGEYVWPQTDEPVYEYACHEGNYSMGNILRGARRLEREAMAAQSASTGDE